jgi:hypothetical protein
MSFLCFNYNAYERINVKSFITPILKTDDDTYTLLMHTTHTRSISGHCER